MNIWGYFHHQVLHNMFYSLLGVLQYTAWEAIILHCYATGRLPYLTNKKVASSFGNIFFFVLSFFFVPLFRGVHFYFSHRLIQMCARSYIKNSCFYQFVRLSPKLLASMRSSMWWSSVTPSQVHPHPRPVQAHPRGAPSQHWHRAFCWLEHASHWGSHHFNAWTYYWILIATAPVLLLMPWPLPSYSWITFPASLERDPLASFTRCSILFANIFIQIFESIR